MLSDFITDLKASKFYDLLFDGYNVVMIYVAGSNLYCATDDRSDYDLIVIVDGEGSEYPNQYLTYDGAKVHWYWRNIDEFIESGNTYPMRYYGNVLFGYITDNNIIYRNDDYAEVIDNLITHKHQIGVNGARLFYNAMTPLINSVLDDECINKVNYTKHLGHLCVTSFFVLDEPIDKELVCNIKRIRWQPCEDCYKEQAVERLKMLRAYMESEINEVEAEIDVLKARIA